MKNKTKFSLLIIYILLFSEGYAQQVYVETGFETAYFKDYVNNLGENTLDLKYAKSQDFFLESGVRFNLYKDRLKMIVGASYNNYKINTGFFVGNTSVPLTYNLTYVGLKTGLNVAIINEPLFKLQAHSHLSYDFLTSGTSKYRDVVNDLITDNTFDRTLIRFHRGLSAEFLFSDTISTYVSYNLADSFREKNQDSNIEEIYTFRTNSFSVGLLFSIVNPRNKCYGGF